MKIRDGFRAFRKADVSRTTGWHAFLGLLLILVLASVVVIAPRVKVGRTITWNEIVVDFPKPVVCCTTLYGFTLFCVPAGKTLLNSFPNLQLITIQSFEEKEAWRHSQPEEDVFGLTGFKEGVKVLASKRFEEGPGEDPDRQPRRIWLRNLLERDDAQVVMAVDAAVVCGETYQAAIYAALSPPWSEDEMLHVVRSVRRFRGGSP